MVAVCGFVLFDQLDVFTAVPVGTHDRSVDDSSVAGGFPGVVFVT